VCQQTSGCACHQAPFVIRFTLVMTAFAFPNLDGGGVPSIPSVPGGKIIQRISRPGLSDLVKESRMADADTEWVLRSQQGDATAFEELVRQHQRMVHALTYRMTGSSADAEDLAQETFLRAYDQIGSFRGTAKFSTWLYRIAVNTCLNWRQREQRRFELHVNCANELLARHTNEDRFINGAHHRPNDGESAGEPANDVQAALLKLPAKQRAAIVLTIYDGLNHAEAAHILGCSETTVSWRVFAARRKLKSLLSQNGGAS
jgi:RNA polymerase sigma-70 factor, ECF subfamily